MRSASVPDAPGRHEQRGGTIERSTDVGAEPAYAGKAYVLHAVASAPVSATSTSETVGVMAHSIGFGRRSA